VNKVQLLRPDDWHIHLRDGRCLQTTVAHARQQFGRAVVMPNLDPPVTTTAQALAYRERIFGELPAHSKFNPLMTLYLTDTTTPGEIEKARASGHVVAAKLYPAGATTNADAGVTDVAKIDAVLAAMQDAVFPLLIHGETSDPRVDIFDREKVFIERILMRLVEKFPRLPIVLEHITTRFAADFVRQAPDNVAATITAHHLLMNRNDLLAGGVRPHLYCLPILKRENDRQALVEAAVSGNPKFFLGTDSAPHPRSRKEAACGCAGIYSAHAAIEIYAEAFDQVAALDKLENFASRFGARFYGLPPHDESITLVRSAQEVPACYPFAGGELVPFRAGGRVAWTRIDPSSGNGSGT